MDPPGTPPAGWAASAPRALGWVTVAYSAALLVRPRLLGDACGYTTATGKLPRPAATLIAAIGARDGASGLRGQHPRGLRRAVAECMN